MIALHVSDKWEASLSRVAKNTHQTKDEIAEIALAHFFEKDPDALIAFVRLENYKRTGQAASAAKVAQKIGIDIKELEALEYIPEQPSEDE